MSLRPDLHGTVLLLAPGATAALDPGQRADLRVEAVQPADEPEFVLVSGHWSGPDGEVANVWVEVRADALPRKPTADPGPRNP